MEILYSIQAVEERMQAQLYGHSSFLVQAMREFIAQNENQIRPAITLFTGELLGSDPQKTIDLAAAIELLNAATQVHDAIVDGRSLNSGGDALKTPWSPEATVLAGDFVFAMAAKLASDTYSTDVMEMFAKTLATIVNGGVTEMFSNGSRFDLEAYYQRIYAKTASLFELATAAAAKLANAGPEIIQAAGQFGTAVGMACQIMKDIVDFDDGSDDKNSHMDTNLRQGILSLPILFYWHICPDDRDLHAIQSKNGHRNYDLDRLILSVRQSGALTQSRNQAQTYIDQALDCLVLFPPSPIRAELQALVESISNMEYALC